MADIFLPYKNYVNICSLTRQILLASKCQQWKKISNQTSNLLRICRRTTPVLELWQNRGYIEMHPPTLCGLTTDFSTVLWGSLEQSSERYKKGTSTQFRTIQNDTTFIVNCSLHTIICCKILKHFTVYFLTSV